MVGTLATVSGAMVMTLLKGPVLLGSHRSNDHGQHNGTSMQHTITGFIMITIGCFSWACFVILQVSVDYSIIIYRTMTKNYNNKDT